MAAWREPPGCRKGIVPVIGRRLEGVIARCLDQEMPRPLRNEFVGEAERTAGVGCRVWGVGCGGVGCRV